MGVLTAKLLTTITFFLISSAAHIAEAEKPKTFSETYGPFNNTHYSIFEVEQNATINNDALQITPDSGSGDFNFLYHSGRVLLKRPFTLWENGANTSRIASFNSSFLINIYRRNNDTPGEGLAFLIAPNLELPKNSSGEYLGLTNSSIDGHLDNQLVAVELDTYKQDFDPDANHVGLNINSVRSVMNESLTPFGIELAPRGERFYNVWIQYDGINKTIKVYIAEQAMKVGPTPPRPINPILSSDLNLQQYLNQYSYFGFSASTGNATQLNCVLKWNLTVEHFPEGKNDRLKIVLGVGVPVLVLLLIGVAGLAYRHKRRQLRRSNTNILGALKNLPGMPREFHFRELKKGTNNFDEKNKLGEGGYGVVYRGLLGRENLEIAVKWFSRESIKGEVDFLAELTIINRLRHKHLVKLLGWCHKNNKLLLVYDYMPNGSLDKHLFAGADTEPLSWKLRYKIISGVASALHYLHIEYNQKVVHRDLKASNIMLDSDFNARLGDFGLARALDNGKTSYAEAEGVLGTIGYIAPECFHTGKATQQSDVYAFGAVLLEVVCGLRPAGTKIGVYQFLVDWVWSLHREGHLLDAVHDKLGDEFVAEEAERILLLGLACSHPLATERPKTQDIVQIILGLLPVPYVPPFKPAFVWPAMLTRDGDITTAETTSFITTSNFGCEWSPQYLSTDEHSLV